MSNVLQHLPEIKGDEQLYVAKLINDMSDEQADRFARIYRERRKDPQTILLLALVGFAGVSGVHRFVVDEIGMGLLYLLTAGLCLIGTLVDVINYKSIAFRYNRRQADEVAALVG
ncbi:MAG: TM2 domain-containing protein [Salinibacter sp.]|uniref:TM2 domain-containing protein n=1 Tax=Salinibacter sp. TaxID=2065818 RepID=UPI0035D41AD5